MARSNSSRKKLLTENPLDLALKPDDELSPEEEELFPKLDASHKLIHLAGNLHGLNRSATLAINEHSLKLKSEGKIVIKLKISLSKSFLFINRKIHIITLTTTYIKNSTVFKN